MKKFLLPLMLCLSLACGSKPAPQVPPAPPATMEVKMENWTIQVPHSFTQTHGDKFFYIGADPKSKLEIAFANSPHTATANLKEGIVFIIDQMQSKGGIFKKGMLVAINGMEGVALFFEQNGMQSLVFMALSQDHQDSAVVACMFYPDPTLLVAERAQCVKVVDSLTHADPKKIN